MMAIADLDPYTRRFNIMELMIWDLILLKRAHQTVRVTMECVSGYDGWMDADDNIGSVLLNLLSLIEDCNRKKI